MQFGSDRLRARKPNIRFSSHADFGNPDCRGCISPVSRGEEADITCNECGAIVRTVRSADLRRMLDEMESQLAVASGICQHCGAVNLFPGFSRMMAFTCQECGKGNASLSVDSRAIRVNIGTNFAPAGAQSSKVWPAREPGPDY